MNHTPCRFMPMNNIRNNPFTNPSLPFGLFDLGGHCSKYSFQLQWTHGDFILQSALNPRGAAPFRLLPSLLGVLEAPHGKSKASSSMDSGGALHGWRRDSLWIETSLSMDRGGALNGWRRDCLSIETPFSMDRGMALYG